MCKRSLFYGALTIAAICVFVAGCGDGSPTKPSPPTPSQIAAVEVIGPESMFSGQSVQFVADIRQADGTTKSTMGMPGLTWRSSNPRVISVSKTGVVTVSGSESGEAVITAAITASGAQGTRTILVRPAVAAALDITREGMPGEGWYVFAVTLTESAGVATTITSMWVTFDDGWGAQCNWTSKHLRQSRVPPNGTLVLDPMTCGAEGAFNVQVSIELKNDNGETTQIYQSRQPVLG